jgi:hypothetical protein
VPRTSQDVELIGDPRNDEKLIVAQLHVLFMHFFPRATLNGLRPIPGGWGIDWSFFFEGIPTPTPGGVRHPCMTSNPPLLPQPSYRIDTELVVPLGDLPGPIPSGISKNSLALRNLTCGFSLGLPSGQSVAKVLGEDLIPDDEL